MDSLRIQLRDLLNAHDWFFPTLVEEKELKMSKIISTIEELLDVSTELSSGESAYIRGKAYSCLKDRSCDAEEWLSKSIKLEPSKPEAWATLGDLAWRQGDADAANHYYNESLRMKRTKEALRELSVIIRQPPKDGDNKGVLDPVRIEDSISLAKEAVQLDLDDHLSWYFLGNACSARYFHASHDRADLRKSLSCYRRSETAGGTINPDLYLNRGNIFRYLGQADLASKDYKKACELDPGLKGVI